MPRTTRIDLTSHACLTDNDFDPFCSIAGYVGSVLYMINRVIEAITCRSNDGMQIRQV